MSGSLENDFLIWAGGSNANVLNQTDYAALPSIVSGDVTGKASAQQANKTWRQASIIANLIATYIVNNAQTAAVDDGTINSLLPAFQAALQIQTPIYLVDTSTSANQIIVTLPSVLAAQAAAGQLVGVPLRVKVANGMARNGLTITGAGGTNVPIYQPNGAMPFPGQVKAGQIIEIISVGNYFQLTAPSTPGIYSWSSSAPPASDQYLDVGEKNIIYYSSVASVKLTTKTVPGIYKIIDIRTATTTSNSDQQLLPNNQTYTQIYGSPVGGQTVYGFHSWSMAVSDYDISAFPSAANTYPVTNAFNPLGTGMMPMVNDHVGSPYFYFDLFYGPTSTDTVRDRGPSIVEMLVSTYTGAKMIKATTGIRGGPMVCFSIWQDTTTAWTSLGTMVDSNGGNLSGTVIVERLA